jgi:hypothetical protein
LNLTVIVCVFWFAWQRPGKNALLTLRAKTSAEKRETLRNHHLVALPHPPQATILWASHHDTPPAGDVHQSQGPQGPQVRSVGLSIKFQRRLIGIDARITWSAVTEARQTASHSHQDYFHATDDSTRTWGCGLALARCEAWIDDERNSAWNPPTTAGGRDRAADPRPFELLVLAWSSLR